MAIQFKKATKSQARLRMAMIGPAGSGKTYSALCVAKHLVPGGRVAVIDTEHGSASKYAGSSDTTFEFDSLEPDSFSPDTYVEAIHAAEQAGYDIIIIDSLSHAWMGKDGALEQVDAAAKRERGNSFGAWRNVTPKHNALVEAIIGSKCHVIATMRSKTEYAQEKDDRGKTVVRKIGLAPIQRDGLEYEFDVTGDLDVDNNFVVGKTRCSALAGKVFAKPGQAIAEILRAWLSDGSPAPVAATKPAPAAPANDASPATGDTLAAYEIRILECESIADCDALTKAILDNLPQDDNRKALGKRLLERKGAIKAALANMQQQAAG